MDIKMENTEHDGNSPFGMSNLGHSITEIAGLPVCKIYDVDEYLKENVPPGKSASPSFTMNKPLAVPSVTSSKRMATTRESQGATDDVDDTDGARVVSQSITTGFPRLLNEYIQSHHANAGIPEYIYTERERSRYSVLLRFKPGYNDIEPEYENRDGGEGGVILHPRQFPSKKLAKEEAARCGLEYLKSLPADHQAVTVPSAPSGDELALSKLNTWCSQNRIELPLYTDLQSKNLPYRYACILKLKITDQTFGDGHPVYQNKKTARTVAAQAALEWIETTNPVLPHATSGAGKIRVLSSGDTLEINATGKSPGELAGAICPYFGFKGPRYDIDKKPDCEGMVDIYACLDYIKSTPDSQGTRIGPLKNVFGAKKAKEQMAKALVQYFMRVAEDGNINLRFTGEMSFSFNI